MKLVLGRQNPTFSVQAVQLRADITYSKATVSVIIDERGLNKYARDYISEIDQLTFAIGKNLLTYQQAVDEISQIAVSKPFSDTYTPEDAIQLMIGFNRVFSDSVSFSDYITAFGFTKGINTPVTTLEQLVFVVTKTLTETVVVVDNADANSGDGLEYTEIKPSSDAASAADLAVAAVFKLLTEAVTLGDLARATVEKPIADSSAVSDLSVLEFIRPLSETSTATDLIAYIFDAYRTYSDSALTSDVLASIGTEKLLTDAGGADSSGSLRMTDYVDITYLAEDYVGISGTFS